MSQQPPSDDTPRGRPSSSSSPPRPPNAQPPGAQRRGGAYDASPYDHELSTDPGRPHAYESLYRGSKERGRPTPRHWQPNLNPPESPAGDDTYGWLYRPEPSAPTQRPSAAVPPVTPVASEASSPVERRPTPTAASSGHAPAVAPRRTGRTVLMALLVVLVLGAAAAVGMIWQS